MTGIDRAEWAGLADGAARFLRTVQALADGDAHQASAMPGWGRAYVLTHVALATQSRTGLLRAVRAGRIGWQASERVRAEAIDVHDLEISG